MSVINHKMTLNYPELGTGPASIEPYVSPEYFEREREKVFRKSWLNVGRTDEIPAAGNYFVREIEVLKSSIIIVRGSDGTVRAMHNVCTHRGNKICVEERGSCKGFQCGFHGWVFDTRGDLVNVPGEQLFFDLDKSKLGLVRLPCEVWNGFIFVHFEQQPPQSLEDFLGKEFYHRFDDYPFEELELQERHRVRVRCNYKVFIDAFQEGLHVAFVHRRSLPDALTSVEAPIVHQEMEVYERHRVASVTVNPEASTTPFGQAMTRHLGASYLFRDESPVARGLNLRKDPLWLFDINVFHPNWRFLAYKDAYLYETYWPISASETVWDLRYYMRRPKTPAEKIFAHAVLGPTDILREDLKTLERTQSGMESGAIKEVHFSDEEVMCRHMHKVIDDAVNS